MANSLSHIRSVVFDFDGTLVDTFPLAFEILNRLSEEYKYDPVDIDDIDELRKLTTKQLFGLFDVPLYKVPFVLKRVQKEMHQVITSLDPIPEIQMVLEKLHDHGYVLGIVSSNIEDSIIDFLHFHQLNMFNFIYGGVLPYTKHYTFRKMFEEQRIDPETTIYIGDEKRDVRASKKVDIPVISVTWGFSTGDVLEKIHPDFMVDHPGQLLKLLIP